MSIIDLGKQSLIYGIGHVLARLITFLLLPLYTHTFTQDEYGALSLAYAFMGFALILYRYGMDTAMMKYSVQKEGSERKKYITLIIVHPIHYIIFIYIHYLFYKVKHGRICTGNISTRLDIVLSSHSIF